MHSEQVADRNIPPAPLVRYGLRANNPDGLPSRSRPYFRLNSNVRLVFQAKGYMEDGDLNHAQVGPSLQFNIRPLEKLKQITVSDLDDIKCMPVVFTIGYRYLPSTAQPSINRLQPTVLLHIPFPRRILVTDRNRFDLDWSQGTFNWIYRNRITAERRLTVRSYRPGPYAAAEFAYQSQFSKWSITRIFAGCLLPLTGRTELDTYYEHVNNTGEKSEPPGKRGRPDRQFLFSSKQKLSMAHFGHMCVNRLNAV